MQIQRHNETVTMSLDESCTIVDVEAHAQLVKDVFCQPEPVLRLEIEADQTQEIDTAYFQLLLAMRSWVLEKGGSVILEVPPQCITEALICYGIRNE